MALGQTRDSDTLTRSNFRTLWCELQKLPDQEVMDGMCSIQIVREGHFLVGWIEWIAIHSSHKEALDWAEVRMGKIEEGYPVLSEEDWGELEHEDAHQAWKGFTLSDRIAACQKHQVSMFAARRDEVPDDPRGELISYLASP